MDKEYKAHQKGAIQVEAEANLGELQTAVRRAIRLEELVEKEKILKAEERRIQDQLRTVRRQIYRVKHGYAEAGGVPAEVATETSVAQFFMPCPLGECRGRLSTAWKCGLCSHFVCSKCHGDKGLTREEDHECKKEDVDTVELLNQNTRPCPKCHMGIFKTDGCDQMWCTQCQTCFSWRTGNILNGVIHNPHYYEFLRQNGGVVPRAPGDIPCGDGLPYLHYVERKLRMFDTQDDQTLAYIRNIHRLSNHLQTVTMRRVENYFRRRPEYQREAGIKYLRGLINKEKWIEQIYRISRQEEKHRRHHQVLETLVVNIAAIMREFIAVNELTPQLVRQRCDQVLEFANTEFRKMMKQYNMTIKILRHDMDTTYL